MLRQEQNLILVWVIMLHLGPVDRSQICLNLKLMHYKNLLQLPVYQTDKIRLIRWKNFIHKKVQFLWTWRKGRTVLTVPSCRAMHQGGWREVKWRAWRCRTTAFLLKPGETWWALHFSFSVMTQNHAPSHRSSDVTSSWSLRNMAAPSITAHIAVNINLTTCLWTHITILSWIQLKILNLERSHVEISGF